MLTIVSSQLSVLFNNTKLCRVLALDVRKNFIFAALTKPKQYFKTKQRFLQA